MLVLVLYDMTIFFRFNGISSESVVKMEKG